MKRALGYSVVGAIAAMVAHAVIPAVARPGWLEMVFFPTSSSAELVNDSAARVLALLAIAALAMAISAVGAGYWRRRQQPAPAKKKPANNA